jgi:hypothetical protein
MPQIVGEGHSVCIGSPHALDQIRATFGDIFAYIHSDHTLDPRWQTDFLQRITLPFPMTVSWDRSRNVSQITCQKRLAAFSQMYSDAFRARGWRKQSLASEAAFRFARNTPAPSRQRIPEESQLI